MPNLNFDIGDSNGLIINTIHLILLIDNSYSMKGSRIAQVNNAIPQIKRKLRMIAESNDVCISVRVIAFSDEPVWVVGSAEQGVPIEDFVWKDLDVVGGTSTNLAVREAAKALHRKNLTTAENAKILRPVVILITDGYCNPNDHNDYLLAIDELRHCLAGNSGKDKITRVAIGVANYKSSELEEFASLSQPSDSGADEKSKPLIFPVIDAEELGKVIEWVVPTSIVNSILSGEEQSPFPAFPSDQFGGEIH